ncbi:3'-phosphoesterase [Nocardioidaceae bacterium]|nr:3'-phosphoesterase [Nocardioidaceae bacterium]
MASGDADLSEYEEKRDFASTPEPDASGDAPSADGPIFVIQRHDASSLHFDWRLEIDGVLVSWAVPKGPSTDPRDKRLATRTEDHPMDYADFEGRIGEGYGAGTVVVWDTGAYEHLTEVDGERVSAAEALGGGHIKVELHGSKLTGAYALTHTKLGGDDSNWLLVKVDDHGADARRNPTSTQNESVLSGKENADFETSES